MMDKIRERIVNKYMCVIESESPGKEKVSCGVKNRDETDIISVNSSDLDKPATPENIKEFKDKYKIKADNFGKE